MTSNWIEKADSERLNQALLEREIDCSNPRAQDVALMLLLTDRDRDALQFFEAVLRDIRPALRRFQADSDFQDEVMQRVRVKLLTADGEGRLSTYRATGSLAAWVRVVVIREGLMMLRVSQPKIHNDDAIIELAFTDPVLSSSRQTFKAAFDLAFREAMQSLTARQRTMLRLCFAEGAQGPELGRLYGVHRTTAFRWLREAREELLQQTRARFLECTPIPDSQVESIMRSFAESLSVNWQ